MVVLCTARKAETKAREEEHKQQDRQQVQQDCHTLSVQNAEMQRQQLAQEPTLEHLASLSELSVLPAVSSSAASGEEVPVLHALIQGVSRVCSSHIALLGAMVHSQSRKCCILQTVAPTFRGCTPAST